jgi:hypothetical protein
MIGHATTLIASNLASVVPGNESGRMLTIFTRLASDGDNSCATGMSQFARGCDLGVNYGYGRSRVDQRPHVKFGKGQPQFPPLFQFKAGCANQDADVRPLLK